MSRHTWQIIDSGKLSAQAVMAKDVALLSQLHTSQDPILHLYEWEGNCLTYGYFTSPEKHLHLDQLDSYQLQMARRPTGGGIIFHLTDFAFSVLIPATHPLFSLNTLENYAGINQCLTHLVKEWITSSSQPTLLPQETACEKSLCLPFCMAKPTIYDVMVEGKKVAGAAQRRTVQGFLHQGSLSLAPLSENMLAKVLKQSTPIIEAMRQQSFYLVSAAECSEEQLQATRQKLKQQLIQHLTKQIF
jgi:lipoate---protein ligase